MGSGMIFKDCDCDDGQTPIIKPVPIDKRSKAYREAIDNIMAADDVSREEAVKMFESAFDKIA